MDADQATARAKAEARRAKILARQKDRLSSITGTYSKPEEPPAVSGVDDPTPVAAQLGAEAVSGAEQPHRSVPHQQQQQQQQEQQMQEQQMQALMATLERSLQHAQALQASAPLLQGQQQQAPTQHPARRSPAPPPPAAPAVDALQSMLGSAAATGTGAASSSDADALLDQRQQQQPQQQQQALLLQLGPALSRSVKQTQLFRLLAAALLAYAALTGWLGQAMGGMLPPVAVLVLTDLAVVLAGAAVLPAPTQAEAAAGAAGVQVPWRLRSLDVVSLVPGLRGLLDSLAGYNAVATAVSQDFAAYVVICGLLLSTNAVPAAVSWGLRF